MLRLREAGRKEPFLNRRQQAFAADGFTRFSFLQSPDLRAQFSDARVFEELFHLQLDLLASEARNHLDRLDRIAAQMKEVVVDADALAAQDVLPDARQTFFRRIARRQIFILVFAGKIRFRQGLPVNLAVGG